MPLPRENDKREVLKRWKNNPNFNRQQTATELNLNVRTVLRWIDKFKIENPEPEIPPENSPQEDQADCGHCLEKERLERTVTELKKEVSFYREDKLTTEDVKRYILELKDHDPDPPMWLLNPSESKSTAIPTIMISDIHGGEVIYPDQVFHVNEYNMEICEQRLKCLCENAIELLGIHINANYPGIVVCLNGDLVSGNIHDEFTITNESPVMPVVLHLWGVLIELLQNLIDVFDNVIVYATAGGNHGRTTRKVPSKNKAFTNFDWLICRFLQGHFQKINEDRIKFFISDGDDIQFKIFEHRYRMTHGDQFRGGQGFIGPFAPITRNDKKKRSAADTYGMGYDTLLIGHFHSLMFLPKVIVNGSVVGYSEYSMNGNFEYESPQQALWLNHHERGITGRYPVFCDSVKSKNEIKTLNECVA